MSYSRANDYIMYITEKEKLFSMVITLISMGMAAWIQTPGSLGNPWVLHFSVSQTGIITVPAS